MGGMTSLVVLGLMSMMMEMAYSLSPDSRGYMVYCPCMGRFGNQADQFLGSLRFAKLLDRTLVLPPWVEYPRSGVSASAQIPFDKYFKVEPLSEYHRVILMRDFMSDIAPQIWPSGNRTVFCYRARDFLDTQTPNSCNAKDGNPFGPFWDYFNIDFDHDEFFGPLLWQERDANTWRQKYPADRWPVLAFTGPPAGFPVSEANSKLHKYLHWSVNIDGQAQAFVDKQLKKPYIGAHLRIGSDWHNACKHVGTGDHLFASPQCLGKNYEHGRLTEEICLPSVNTVVKQLTTLVHKYRAKSVFLARDSTAYDKDITSALEKLSVSVHWLPKDNPHLDLAVLAKSDHYIANCVSSFSSFATRERRAQGLDISFWAFSPQTKDEL